MSGPEPSPTTEDHIGATRGQSRALSGQVSEHNRRIADRELRTSKCRRHFSAQIEPSRQTVFSSARRKMDFYFYPYFSLSFLLFSKFVS
jgi:hypothetical protein